MNPFFFGSSARPLFGAYESAANATRGAVVVCAPLGNEYLFAHPTLRRLSRLLADTGYHVLRFDYTGTGDSADDFAAVDETTLADDVRTAIAEIRDLSQQPRVSLIGLRYGATLAAQVAHGNAAVDRLVLWNPIVDGVEYLAEFGARGVPPDADIDAEGLVLTPRLHRVLERVSHDSFRAPLPPTLVLATADPPHPALRALHDQLAAAGVASEWEHVPDVPAWRNAFLTAAGLPVRALQRIVAWMS